MRVCVTGATGFVGCGVLPALTRAGIEVHALVRPGSESKLARDPLIYPRYGEALDPDSFALALAGCDALVHLVGIRRAQMKETGLTYDDVDVSSVRVALEAMKRAGVDRIVLLSAAAIGQSTYVQSKAKAERLVTDSGARWTILRPSFILGPGQRWPIILTPFLWTLSRMTGRAGDMARHAQNISRIRLAYAILWSLEHADAIGHVLDVQQIKKLK